MALTSGRGRCCVPFGAETTERVVLGTCLARPGAISRVATVLTDVDFHSTGHRSIFQAMLHLQRKQIQVDPVLVATTLDGWGRLKNAGGAPYLASLIEEDALPDRPEVLEWVEFYARSVGSWAIARSVEVMAFHLIKAAASGSRQAMADSFADLHRVLAVASPDPLIDPIAFDAARSGSTVVALYRWFDSADALLYIGITGDVASRQDSHARRSSWAQFAVRSTVERHPNRDRALAAERAAIEAERPLFNHVHNDTPEARRRLVEYLVRHGRADLLAPAVSRG